MGTGMPVWLTALGVAGTWLIAVIAIWGERIRSWFFKPKLEIALLNPKGELVTRPVTSGGASVLTQQSFQTRYYHIRLINKARWPVAHDAQVQIIQMEEPGPAANRKLSTPACCRCPGVMRSFILRRELLGLRQTPTSCSCETMAGSTSRRCSSRTTSRCCIKAIQIFGSLLQARSTEADSKPLRLQIAWDGKWDQGEAEMAKHIRSFSV